MAVEGTLESFIKIVDQILGLTQIFLVVSQIYTFKYKVLLYLLLWSQNKTDYYLSREARSHFEGIFTHTLASKHSKPYLKSYCNEQFKILLLTQKSSFNALFNETFQI